MAKHFKHNNNVGCGSRIYDICPMINDIRGGIITKIVKRDRKIIVVLKRRTSLFIMRFVIRSDGGNVGCIIIFLKPFFDGISIVFQCGAGNAKC